MKKYTLSLENVLDYTMMSIMAGDLYLIDTQNNRTLLSKMVMANFQFIENDTKVLFPILKNEKIDGIYNWFVQLAIADLHTETIVFYDKKFKNNGESIVYENNNVSVVNESNDFVKTETYSLYEFGRERTEKFEIASRIKHYYKRYWNEDRGDEFSVWGKSWWYFETDEEGNILRQLEEYDNGVVQSYSLTAPQNRFGGLGEIPLSLKEFAEYTIFKEDFEAIWAVNTVEKEKNLYTILEAMHPCPGMYLGESSLTAMWHFVSGYNTACWYKGIEETLKPRFELFHEFVKRKTGFSESTGGWKYMILNHCEGDEARALDLFFSYFYEFKKGEELSQFIKTLVPKDKHDMDFDKILDFHWYNYAELKPIMPELLAWLQDPNWPVARPISAHLKTMLPDILPDLVPILDSEDGIWKYNILNYFFIETQSEHYIKILDIIKRLAHKPTENDKKEEVDLLAQEILRGYQH